MSTQTTTTLDSDMKPGACRITIRPATFEDLPAISLIEQEVYADEGPWPLEDFQADFSDEDSSYLVAECGRDIVGYGAAGIYDDGATITMLTVLPSHRRRGIAQLFLEELLAWCDESDVSEVSLQVRVGNDGAIKMYELAGFVLADTLYDYYSPGVDALEYVLPL